MNKTKLAAPDQEFEQSFFQLAYEKLQEKLYNLLPFMVGFEIVNKNDDGTRAIGVFGFQSNNGQIIYVPAFFVNGTVKGVDILYSKNNEQFYPLNEDFAELFLKDDATGIGDVSHETDKQINQTTQPTDLRDLVRPPRTGKTSYACVIDDLRREDKHKYATVMDFIQSADPVTKTAFYNTFAHNDDYMETVLRFYDIEKVAKALVRPIEKKETKEKEVFIVTPKENQKIQKLADDEKANLLNTGYLFVDHRSQSKKSKVGLFSYPEKFSTANESGFYMYVTDTGSIRRGLVLVGLQQLHGNVHPHDAMSLVATLVIDMEEGEDQGKGYLVKSKDVFVKDHIKVKDLSAAFDLMEDLADAKPSFEDIYVLINKELRASQPFRVLANFKDDNGVRRIKVERLPPALESKLDEQVELIQLKRPGKDLIFKGNTVGVPLGFKVMNVSAGDPSEFTKKPEDENKKAPYFAEKLESAIKEQGKEEDAEKKEWKEKMEAAKATGRPGTLAAITYAMQDVHVYPMTVRSNGSEYFTSIKQVKKKYNSALSAKIGMVLDFGLDPKEAESFIDDVPMMGKKKATIMLGEGLTLDKIAYTGDYTSQLQDPSSYANELGQPTYDGVGNMQVAPQDGNYNDDPTQIGRGTYTPPEGLNGALSRASQLGQAGQKQIFDTHSIATLAKYVTPGTKVQTYMPDFVSALDKLGRMLFLVYWETDKFEEMYGRSELPELVELLTDVFKNLGDLVIFLKRKSPEISINMEKDEIGE